MLAQKVVQVQKETQEFLVLRVRWVLRETTESPDRLVRKVLKAFKVPQVKLALRDPKARKVLPELTQVCRGRKVLDETPVRRDQLVIPEQILPYLVLPVLKENKVRKVLLELIRLCLAPKAHKARRAIQVRRAHKATTERIPQFQVLQVLREIRVHEDR